MALEDSDRRFRKRMDMMLHGERVPDLGMVAYHWDRLSAADKDFDAVDQIHRWLEEHRETAKLVVIDTLAKIRSRKEGNDSAYDRDYRDLEGLQGLAATYSVSILVVHHKRKAKADDPYDTVLGSTGITASADCLWILDKSARGESDGTLFISGRDVEEQKGALRFDRETGLWRWIGDAAEVNMTKQRADIRGIVKAGGGRPVAIKDIVEISGREYRSVQSLINRMVSAGELVRAAGQRGKLLLPPEDQLYGGAPEPSQGGNDESINLEHP